MNRYKPKKQIIILSEKQLFFVQKIGCKLLYYKYFKNKYYDYTHYL